MYLCGLTVQMEDVTVTVLFSLTLFGTKKNKHFIAHFELVDSVNVIID